MARTYIRKAKATPSLVAAPVRGAGRAAKRRQLAAALTTVEHVMRRHFPEALHALKAALAVIAVGCLEDNTQPTAMVFIAHSGAGKTLVVMLVTPEADDTLLRSLFYRSDKFTAASFVSHKANVGKEALKKIDLLPRIRGKTMLTKELSPVFAGKRDELMDRFSMLTSVLDGQGFTSDTGAHGQHGYEEPANFQWLGASTPLQLEALELMTQLGTRFVFYNADRAEKTVDELTALLEDPHRNTHFPACRESVQSFLRTFYAAVLPGSIHTADITFPSRLVRLLALWTKTLVALRAPVKWDRMADRISDVGREYPERMGGVLKNIAIGSALIHGRDAVEDADLAQIGHIACSSGVERRGKILRALLRLDGRATSSELEEETDLSKPTVLKYAKELSAVGLAGWKKAEGPKPMQVWLRKPFKELCAAPSLNPNG